MSEGDARSLEERCRKRGLECGSDPDTQWPVCGIAMVPGSILAQRRTLSIYMSVGDTGLNV